MYGGEKLYAKEGIYIGWVIRNDLCPYIETLPHSE